MRPRFTSFTSMRNVPVTFPLKQPLTPSAETDDSHDSRSSGVTRSTTSAVYTRPRAKSGGDLLQRANTTGMIPRHGLNATWKTPGDASSTSQLAETDDPDDTDDREWGLEKGMELFEVSAKDDIGANFACIGITRDLHCAHPRPNFKVSSSFSTPYWPL